MNKTNINTPKITKNKRSKHNTMSYLKHAVTMY